MKKWNALAAREERAGENGISVPDDDQVRQTTLAVEGIESRQQECKLTSVRSRTDSKEGVRPWQRQFSKEYLGHRESVVLT